MNKFKYLQIVGTITVLSPIILVMGAALIFWVSLIPKTETVEVVETEKPDTAIVVQETKPIVTKPTPVVKPTPPPPPPVSVVKDTVKPVVESLDTTK